MQVIDGKETYDAMNASGGIQSTTMVRAVENGISLAPTASFR